MKHYFLVAKNVGDLTAIVCAALEEREAKAPAALDRLVNGFRRRPDPFRGPAISRSNTTAITVARRDAFERDPVNLIRLFSISDRYSLPIHPDATRLVTLSLRRIDAALRENHEANRLFMDILTSRNAPEIVLRRMNEAGVLGRFIPEFGRIVAMMQFNMYHHYTVDEHLLRAVGILAEIDAGRSQRRAPARQRASCRRSSGGRRSTWRCSCTTSPRGAAKTIRWPGRRLPSGSDRDSACPTENRTPGLARRKPPRDVQHGPEPRPRRSAHDRDLRRHRELDGATEMPDDPDHLRHQGGRTRACGTAGRDSCCAPSTAKPKSMLERRRIRCTDRIRPCPGRQGRSCGAALADWSDEEFERLRGPALSALLDARRPAPQGARRHAAELAQERRQVASRPRS